MAEPPEEMRQYLESLSKRLDGIEDAAGNKIPPFTEPELASLTLALFAFFARDGGSVYRYALKLSKEERKHLLALVGLLPVIAAAAEKGGKPLLWLAADTGALSSARNDLRAFNISASGLEFMTWADFGERAGGFFGGNKADRFWVIGDLDYYRRPPDGEIREAARKAAEMVAANAKAPALILHQSGGEPVLALERFKA